MTKKEKLEWLKAKAEELGKDADSAVISADPFFDKLLLRAQLSNHTALWVVGVPLATWLLGSIYGIPSFSDILSFLTAGRM